MKWCTLGLLFIYNIAYCVFVNKIQSIVLTNLFFVSFNMQLIGNVFATEF